jgi:hypothetical protein
MKTLKIATLLAQLILSFHGEGHPPHDEHKSSHKVVATVSR